jgi:hypothetical protein
LGGAIERLAYSIDARGESFLRALREAPGAGDGHRQGQGLSALKRQIAEYAGRATTGAVSFEAAVRGKRLILRLPASPPKGLRIQDIVREAFGIGNPVCHLRRDEVVLKPPGSDL